MGYLNTDIFKNNYVSIAKAIGIILVVVWHSRPIPAEIGIYVMFFAVPLFFFTSGYFFNPMNIKTLCSFYLKKIRGLYVPFIKWSLFFLLLHNVFYYINIYNDQYGFNSSHSYLYSLSDFKEKFISIVFFMNSPEALLGAFWFIKTLFIVVVFIGTIGFFLYRMKCYNIFVLLTISFIVVSFSSYFNLSFPIIGDFSRISFASVFFLLGCAFKSFESRISFIYTNKCFLLISFMVSLSGLLYYKKVVSVIGFNTSDVIPYTILATSGIVLVFQISKMIEKVDFLASICCFIGRNTLTILALHFLCFKVVSLIKIWIYNWPIERLGEFPTILDGNSLFWLLYAFMGIALPLFTVQLYLLVKRSISKYALN